MKKLKSILSLAVVTLALGVSSCAGASHQPGEAMPTYYGAAETEKQITTFLVLGEGKYNGAAGVDDEALVLTNAVKYVADPGSNLPNEEIVTSNDENLVFSHWTLNEGNDYNRLVETVPEFDYAVLYANYKRPGGDSDSNWCIVGDGQFLPNPDGDKWTTSNAIRFVKNDSSMDPNCQDEFKAIGVHFYVGDLWKVSDGKTWVEGDYQNESGSALNAGHLEIVGGNLKVLTEGIYDIYFKVMKTSGYLVWTEYKGTAK